MDGTDSILPVTEATTCFTFSPTFKWLFNLITFAANFSPASLGYFDKTTRKTAKHFEYSFFVHRCRIHISEGSAV